MKIKILSHDPRSVTKYLVDDRFASVVRDLGVEIVDTGQDLAIKAGTDIAPLYEVEGPVAIDDCSDSPILRPHLRKVIEKSQCLGIFRNCVTRHPAMQNACVYQSDSCHVQTAFSFEGAVTPDMWDQEYVRYAPIRYEFLKKIHLAFPLVPVIEMGQPSSPHAADLPMLAERPIDVMFIGQVKYTLEADGIPAMATLHRTRMEHEMRKIDCTYKIIRTDCTPERADPTAPRRMPKWEYMAAMQQAKIAILPWGWSGWSWRDAEAVLAGCICIKPHTDEFQLIPDMFSDDSDWYYKCHHTFADLCDVVRMIRGHVQDKVITDETIRAKTQQYHDLCNVPVSLKRYITLLRRCLEGHQWG